LWALRASSTFAAVAVFERWTVLPHKPIHKLSENLWRVQGTMPDGAPRVMAVARLGDGRLIIHSAIALEEPAMKELEAFGAISVILVPNGFHRQDARIWKDRYPAAKVCCPNGARKRVEKVVPVDGGLEDVPADENVRAGYLDGCAEREGYLEVRSQDGTSLVFNDGMFNLPPLSGIRRLIFGPTGRLAVTRLFKLLAVKDKAALAKHLERLAASPNLVRVIVSHGSLVTEDAAAKIRQAIRLDLS
jgi:hypothetical protein